MSMHHHGQPDPLMAAQWFPTDPSGLPHATRPTSRRGAGRSPPPARCTPEVGSDQPGRCPKVKCGRKLLAAAGPPSSDDHQGATRP
jgi:hypothetical protein